MSTYKSNTKLHSLFFFFFSSRRRHTRLTCDWSSDVCSSDLGDILLALSTSGNSANVIAALQQARRRELETVAMVGYDGGRVASEGLADHVVVTRSQHIPRIQEAQASGYHVLRELVER